MKRNGRLPESDLASIPGGKLEKEAAAAWNAMRREIIRRGGPAISPGGPDSSYRSFVRQVYWKNYWANLGQPQKAATPGTSNHGWGRAVDEPRSDSQRWILKLGPKYGWSHAEGASVGEPWHFTYIGGYKPGKSEDPLTKSERAWVNEYKKLKAANENKARRANLRRRMTQQRKAIWRAAQRSGWNIANRRERYRILRGLTK